MADTILGNLAWKITGDTTDFDKKIDSSDKKINAFAKRIGDVGKDLTLKVSVPLAALGGIAVKSASDLSESINAVNVVFEDAASTINNFGETASKAVGLSQTGFNELATVIGAQLKQSGQDIDTVAESTVNLVERSADLASVFNTDVADAAGALGAALRGESEPARRFAINISDAAVQAEALASGLVSTKDEITDQIKVQARYNLILKQSADVAGDFANTSDGLANRTRILKADLTNLAAEFGEILIPVVTDVVGKIGEIVENFSNLDDSTKRTIVEIAGLAAAIGPLLLIASKAITTFKALNLALAGPVGLAVAAGVVAVGGLIALKNTLQQAAIEERFERANEELRELAENSEGSAKFIEEFAKQTGVSLTKAIDLADEQGLITDEIQDQVDLLKEKAAIEKQSGLTLDQELEQRDIIVQLISRAGSEFRAYGTEQEKLAQGQEVVIAQVARIAELTGLSADQVLSIALTVENTTELYKRALNSVVLLNKEISTQGQIQEGLAEAERIRREEAEKAAAEAAAKQAEIDAANQAALDAQIKAEEELSEKRQGFLDDYENSFLATQEKFKIGLIDQKEAFGELINITEQFASKLIESGFTDETILEGLVAQINKYKTALDEIINAEEALDEANQNTTESSRLFFDQEFLAFKRQKEEIAAIGQQRVDTIIRSQQLQKEAAEELSQLVAEEQKERERIAKERIKTAAEAAKNEFQINKRRIDATTAALNEGLEEYREIKAEEVRINEEAEDEKQRKQKETFDIIGQGLNALTNLVTTSFDNQIRSASESSSEQERLERERFNALKLIKAAEATINTIVAITANPALAIPLGIIGAANVAAILATQPGSPSAPFTTEAVETAEPEIIEEDEVIEAPRGEQVTVIEVDGEAIYKVMQNGIDNGQVRLTP